MQLPRPKGEASLRCESWRNSSLLFSKTVSVCHPFCFILVGGFLGSPFPPPPYTLSLADKEKTWDNLLDKSWPQKCWTHHVLKTMQGKMQVYHCIYYSASEKWSSRGQGPATLDILLPRTSASGWSPTWNMLLSSFVYFFLFLNVWGLLRTVTTNLYPRRKCWAEMEMLLTLMSAGGNMFCIYYHSAGGVCKCLEILPATARRAMREDAAWGPLLLLKQALYCEKHYLRRLRSKGICVYCL